MSAQSERSQHSNRSTLSFNNFIKSRSRSIMMLTSVCPLLRIGTNSTIK